MRPIAVIVPCRVNIHIFCHKNINVFDFGGLPRGSLEGHTVHPFLTAGKRWRGERTWAPEFQKGIVNGAQALPDGAPGMETDAVLVFPKRRRPQLGASPGAPGATHLL